MRKLTLVIAIGLAITLVLAGCRGESTGRQGRKATENDCDLLEAGADGNLARVNKALEAGAYVDARNWEGRTTLYLVTVEAFHNVRTGGALQNYTKTAELLINNGATVDAKDNDGGTPLFSAVLFGETEIVALLLKAGADANERDNDGSTPLHCASQCGSTGGAELLLNAGAEINARTDDGDTPLKRAVFFHNSAMEEFLRQHGAVE